MRIACGVAYQGTQYSGWQRQAEIVTVQSMVEASLSQIAQHTITTHCAGRTDAGVHASGQVIHFDTTAKRHADAWVRGTNSHLPPDIRVMWAQAMPADFHARFSADSRRYCYYIDNSHVLSPSNVGRVTWVNYPLDEKAMHEAAQILRGEHDFSAFRAAACQARVPMRCIDEISVTRQAQYICVAVTANAFLHHMVRNIVGSLLYIGSGQNPPTWLAEVLRSRDRTQAAITAPPDGLYLTEVNYPAHYKVPKMAAPAIIFF